ncbi:MAG TPA: ABC transporter permease [Methanomassiliicoccales archaeon]|nr:ABC transporter permease [Methanomassiliicoccales archaeon]
MSEASWYQSVPGGLRAAWAVAKKDMRIYYIKPNIIVSGLLFPLFMFLAFSVGNTSGPSVMIPGLIAITLLFSASSIEPVSIPIERRTKTFDRLLAAPTSLNSVVLGESTSGFLYSLLIALIVMVAGVVVFGTPILRALPLIFGMVLTSFVFASMGTLFAAYPTESPGDIMSILNVVRLPLIFISGVFIPLSDLPAVGQAVSYLSPLTYGNDLIQAAYSGTSHFSPYLDVAMLLAFLLAFQLLAYRLYKKFNA